MTAPELVGVVAMAMFSHEQCDGRQKIDLEANWLGRLNDDNRDEYRDLARAVLAALTEAGTVQFGVRWHVGGCSGINRCTSKRHAERQAAKLIESGHEATVVSRLTLPWTAVEG